MNPIVVMPDFFVDRVIKLRSREELFNSINDKARFGGGEHTWYTDYRYKGRKCEQMLHIAYPN